MRRYTTPTHIYTLPFDTSIINKLRVIYAQNDAVILTKEVAECQLKDNAVTITLTQEETALFDCKKMFVEVQMHILTHGGQSLVSRPLKVSADKCLSEGVLE